MLQLNISFGFYIYTYLLKETPPVTLRIYHIYICSVTYLAPYSLFYPEQTNHFLFPIYGVIH